MQSTPLLAGHRLLWLVLVFALEATAQSFSDKVATATTIDAAARRQIIQTYNESPLSFEPNVGQIDAKARFISRGPGYAMFLTSDEAVLKLAKGGEAPGGLPARETVVRMKFVKANPRSNVAGRDELPGKTNYIIGNDPKKWHTRVATYARVQYEDVYPGIDLIYYGNQGQLEYDLIVAPGADVNTIGLRFDGADRLELDPGGNLILHTPGGNLRHATPFIYQHVDGKRRQIPGGYVLNGKNHVGFQVGSYDSTKPLIIDPTLVYSTYLGGGSLDLGYGIAVDGTGNAYVTGYTYSADFPVTAGALDPTPNGSADIFVTKLNAAGSAPLVYSTYLGGRSDDYGHNIAVDGAGDAYVIGYTFSNDFPTTPAAFDTTFNGLVDVFITKLNPAGSVPLAYSTYLGGADQDIGYAIAVDASGAAYATGDTCSLNFPTTLAAFDTTYNLRCDAFVTKLDASGSTLFYSTYLGGSFNDIGSGIGVDPSGSAYVTGSTSTSGIFPTTPLAYDTSGNGLIDAFVTKLNATGSALIYSTYLGGSGNDNGQDIALEPGGTAYVTGQTDSGNFPATPAAFDTTANGNFDAFVTRLDATGSALVYSTYLGGSAFDVGAGIGVDATGNAYIAGYTISPDFPVTSGAFATTSIGGVDVFVAKLNPAGSAPLVYSTYLGGSGDDFGLEIAVDASGAAYITGYTLSTNFPTTPQAFDASSNGVHDAFVSKITDAVVPATLTLEPPADTNVAGQQHCVTATVRDAAGNPVSGISVQFNVTGANTAAGTSTTDSNGRATFCYTGTRAGLDTIRAFADTNTNGTQDATGEPAGDAAKTYQAGPPATLVLAPPTDVNTAGQQHCVTATVRDAFGNPVPGITVRFNVAGANTASGAQTTDAGGQATFCYTGTRAGLDTITAFADTNNNGTRDATEPSGTAAKTYLAGPPATVTLTPSSAGNTVDTQHCVTATVRDAFGNPVADQTVQFTITGSVNTNGQRETDAGGNATFCYTGPPLPGTDAITAFADADDDGTQDPGEPSGTATKSWVLPMSTPLCEISINNGGQITAANGDRATFGGNAKLEDDGETRVRQEYQDHGPAQPMNVHSIAELSIVCNGATQATIYGQARIDGQGSFFYRIRVQDLADPGTGRDTYGILLQNGYNSGEQVLEGGNVQIRRN